MESGFEEGEDADGSGRGGIPPFHVRRRPFPVGRRSTASDLPAFPMRPRGVIRDGSRTRPCRRWTASRWRVPLGASGRLFHALFVLWRARLGFCAARSVPWTARGGLRTVNTVPSPARSVILVARSASGTVRWRIFPARSVRGAARGVLFPVSRVRRSVGW